MAGRKVVSLCQQIAQLGYELEQEMATLGPSSVTYLRGQLVQIGGTRAVGVFDSATRKPEFDYNLAELKG